MSRLLLIAHIAAGFLSLVAAFVAAATRTFDLSHRWHVHAGRAFFAGMAAVFITAVPLALLSRNTFILLIAIFSFYLASAGWRYARNRKGTPRGVDWLRSAGMLVVSLAMVAYGIYRLAVNVDDGVIMLVFAAIGGALSAGELKLLADGGATGADRVARHLTMMLAGLIATLTAFVVVNLSLQPAWVLWLGPTIVVTPLIVWWNFRIRRGFRPRGTPPYDA